MKEILKKEHTMRLSMVLHLEANVENKITAIRNKIQVWYTSNCMEIIRNKNTERRGERY
jgi:hypothetical protein